MKSLYQIFYTHKRAELLLAAKGIKAKVMKITIVRPSGKFYNCVQVIYKVAGSVCSTFLSCKEFLKRAIENRKDAGNDYFVSGTDTANQYHVYGKDADLLTQPGYIVTASKNAIACECLDYQKQSAIYAEHPYLWKQLFKEKQICKHGFAVLRSIFGLGKLSTYLKIQAKAA